jgi:uncharacterized protein YciI
MYWLLTYDLVDDYLERRTPVRQAHLALVQAAHDHGEIVLAGALADPPDTAVLVFKSDSPAAAEDFAGSDPYVKEGLVIAWRVRRWNVVIGNS